MKRKKSVRFFLLLPIIDQLINEGYTQQSIVEKLQMDHELDLNLNTFKSYLYRYRSQDKKTQEESYSNKPKTETSSGFLSSFQDAEKKENDLEESKAISLADRQGMKGDISRSRAKAKELLDSLSLSKLKIDQ
ncbi:hypothetical protein BEN74_00575 (plasmid) [Acinetobacter sp. WCHAc010034]|uniref:hypothetical protein n=1 Tax=Acinetobacter sp. WCHAc010034 TaxID=1879049 RepID=UPI00083A2E72|nr:hypothetical protein [Acinetobacter sp. WCHAc010034]AYA01514.1 hypothetical protein BEN74_00575 [Acinetobacter sp. WCHAc010034]